MKKIIIFTCFSFILLSFFNFSFAATYPSTCPDVAQTILTSFGSCSAINCTTYSNICAKCCARAPSTCTSFTYSNWSVCSPDRQQTRTIISSGPNECIGGSPIMSQSCNYAPATPKSTSLPTPTPKPTAVSAPVAPSQTEETNPFANSRDLRGWEPPASSVVATTSTETATPVSEIKPSVGFIDLIINLINGFFKFFGFGR